jgi:hypothetical protein
VPYQSEPAAGYEKKSMNDTVTFVCNICGEPSTDICVHCTKDTCANHRCEKCQRCSDCCQCEFRRTQD